MIEFWYRYEDKAYAAPLDEFDNPIGSSSLEIELRKYLVLSHTPKGAWIDLGFMQGKKFVRKDARKRFACSTREEAKESFIARKGRQIRIHQATVDRAKRAIARINGDMFA